MQQTSYWPVKQSLIALMKGAIVLGITLILVSAASAAIKQTVLYNFAGGSSDGEYPTSGLIADKAGNLYGVTPHGGSFGNCSPFGQTCGTVFQLKRNSDGSYTENLLYTFTGGTDGGEPYGTLVMDSSGNLYGTAYLGGTQTSCPGGPCGVVFQLSPKAGGGWTESVIHSFGGSPDGAYPQAGLVARGNTIFGTTNSGGVLNACSNGFAGYGCGTVFALTHTASGWKETILYSFTGFSDGGFPYSSVTLDAAGNIYGTTNSYGYLQGCNNYGCGTVYKLTKSGGYSFSTIYTFLGGSDGGSPEGGVVIDAAGNVYGTTAGYGNDFYGVVFQLKPSGGSYTQSTIYTFTGGPDGGTPIANLVGKGTSLFGTTYAGGTGGGCFFGASCGVVFRLARSGSGWSETVLWTFSGGLDGGEPEANVAFDPAGNLYSTALIGGTHTIGIAFKLSQ